MGREAEGCKGARSVRPLWGPADRTDTSGQTLEGLAAQREWDNSWRLYFHIPDIQTDRKREQNKNKG